MPEELTTAVELAFRHRVRHGVRKPHNWLQLTRFAAVGGESGQRAVRLSMRLHFFLLLSIISTKRSNR